MIELFMQGHLVSASSSTVFSKGPVAVRYLQRFEIKSTYINFSAYVNSNLKKSVG